MVYETESMNVTISSALYELAQELSEKDNVTTDQVIETSISILIATTRLSDDDNTLLSESTLEIGDEKVTKDIAVDKDLVALMKKHVETNHLDMNKTLDEAMALHLGLYKNAPQLFSMAAETLFMITASMANGLRSENN